jgi:hypothetical protein
VAEAWLFEAWAARERASFALPPSRLALEPSDCVRIVKDGRPRLFRVTEIGERGAREIEARSIDPGVYGLGAAPDRPRRVLGPDASGQPMGELLDLPLLRGDEPAHVGYFAAAQRPWPGAVALYRSPADAGFTLKALAPAPAVTGLTLVPLPRGPAGRWDRATRIRVQVEHGELASVTELQLLGGANAAAVVNGDGEWEVLQFATATLLAPRTYELSGLFRGQRGTEGAMRSPVAAGARFVLLDAAIVQVDMTPDEAGRSANWKYGPANRDIGHSSYVSRQHAFRGTGLRPLSPVHVRGRRSGGDLALTWVRRTRLGGDSWEAAEVPLGEDSERYEVDVLDGAVVKRTLACTTPAVVYTAAQQSADFAAVPSLVTVRVYQLSATWGRGIPCEATV